ncbi:DUF3060 domain-containing protein [Microbacterium sp. NPDC055903]
MHRTTALTATAALLLALTGCAVTVTEPPSSASPVVEESSQPTTQETAEAPEDALDDPVPATDDSTWSEEVGSARADTLAAATKTVTCSGELVLGDTMDAQFVAVEGVCEHLVVQMDGGAVVAGDVVTLDVYGDAGFVYVDSVSALNVSGSGNVVYWTGSAPQVNETGAGNVLTAG